MNRAKRIDWLEEHGFFVGERDPRFNRAFEGKFMVCEQGLIDAGISTDRAYEGAGHYCVVGDNLNVLVDETFDRVYTEEVDL